MLSEHGATLAGINERLARIEATLSEHGATLSEHGAMLSGVNERMARIEGTVAGALGRPFPELMARLPDATAAE